MVDFNDDRFKVFEDHDIESKNMEAHVALIFFRLTILVLMSYRW